MSKKHNKETTPPPDDDALKHLEQKLDEMTGDLLRTRADFENYRKRVELEKEQVAAAAQARTILQLLPVIDNIERALQHLPDHLKDDAWAQSVVNLTKNLDKTLQKLHLSRVDAAPGTEFDPQLHEAVHMDDGDGQREVIAEELQSGYRLGESVIRHSMVKVTRQ